MKLVVVAALLALVACGPARAIERATDAEEFRGYIDACRSNTDERGVEGCIADQVSAKVGYLGDILAETANNLTDARQKLLHAAEDKFEAYGQAACSYQLSAETSAGKRAEQFCLLRLTNQRIADVLEGEDFLAQE